MGDVDDSLIDPSCRPSSRVRLVTWLLLLLWLFLCLLCCGVSVGFVVADVVVVVGAYYVTIVVSVHGCIGWKNVLSS